MKRLTAAFFGPSKRRSPRDGRLYTPQNHHHRNNRTIKNVGGKYSDEAGKPVFVFHDDGGVDDLFSDHRGGRPTIATRFSHVGDGYIDLPLCFSELIEDVDIPAQESGVLLELPFRVSQEVKEETYWQK